MRGKTSGKSRYWALHIWRKPDVRELATLLRVKTATCLFRKWRKILEKPRGYFDVVEISSEDRAEMKNLYESGQSCSRIATLFEIGSRTVYAHLVKAGVRIRGARISDPEQVAIVALYREGLTTHEISNKFGVNQASVWDVLRRRSEPRRAKGPRLRIPSAIGCQMASAYSAGKSIEQVAREFGCSYAGARKAILRAGGRIRPRLVRHQ